MLQIKEAWIRFPSWKLRVRSPSPAPDFKLLTFSGFKVSTFAVCSLACGGDFPHLPLLGCCFGGKQLHRTPKSLTRGVRIARRHLNRPMPQDRRNLERIRPTLAASPPSLAVRLCLTGAALINQLREAEPRAGGEEESLGKPEAFRKVKRQSRKANYHAQSPFFPLR